MEKVLLELKQKGISDECIGQAGTGSVNEGSRPGENGFPGAVPEDRPKPGVRGIGEIKQLFSLPGGDASDGRYGV